MKKFYSFMLMAAMAAGAMAQGFVSDGTGNVYTFNSLSQIEGTGVTLQDDGSYLVAADFTISEGDVLQIENNDIIKMANNVRININGDADFAPADTAVVTRDAEGSNPKGFWMLGDNGNANLKNVTFEYVGVTFGGINSSLTADNCTFYQYNGKMNSSGALGFNASCDNNIVENCRFIECNVNAIGNGATNPVGIIIRNCLFWHNVTSNRNKPQINLTVGGGHDVLIADNEIIGGQFTMSGGIALSNMMGLSQTGTNIIENNYIADNRYGITTISGVDAIIRNNTMIDNHYETNPTTAAVASASMTPAAPATSTSRATGWKADSGASPSSPVHPTSTWARSRTPMPRTTTPATTPSSTTALTAPFMTCSTTARQPSMHRATPGTLPSRPPRPSRRSSTTRWTTPARVSSSSCPLIRTMTPQSRKSMPHSRPTVSTTTSWVSPARLPPLPASTSTTARRSLSSKQLDCR